MDGGRSAYRVAVWKYQQTGCRQYVCVQSTMILFESASFLAS